MKKQELTAEQKSIINKINLMKKYYQEIEEIQPIEKDIQAIDFRDFTEQEEIDFQKEIKKIA
jgi:hypothetical protein